MSSRAPLSLDLRSLREEPRMIATGALTCQQYDTSCRAWVPCAAVAGEGARESSRSRAERGSTQPLKVVTFNVWFSEMKRDARTKHILELCREHEPDFICLQEVVPSTLRVIAHNEWVQENYFLTDSDASTIMHYGVVILSRARPLSAHLLVLPSRMDRYLVSVTAMVGGVEVLCATVHLESLSSRDHRERQMRAIRQWIGDHPNVVWMGDFNFDDRRNWADDDDRPLEELTLREVFGGFTDVWLHTHGSEDGWTFDTEKNGMLKALQAKHERMRYDRIMSRLAAFTPAHLEMLGCDTFMEYKDDAPYASAIPIAASDHFGLVATFNPTA
eukprot:TRINITY_DN3756_c0_g1_i2.p1 TRINITY_DN3756_c0_g1~~TRINITY_DN3756_c0_g1_i2.p1  ORF type:complete len:330 (-),score=62.23 TRINITY_DN3756_c0_g1_i2:221-1210(-)